MVLGISFTHTSDCIEINQQLYVEKLLKRFSMSDCFTKNVPCDSSFSDVISVDSNELADPTLLLAASRKNIRGGQMGKIGPQYRQ